MEESLQNTAREFWEDMHQSISDLQESMKIFVFAMVYIEWKGLSKEMEEKYHEWKTRYET